MYYRVIGKFSADIQLANSMEFSSKKPPRPFIFSENQIASIKAVISPLLWLLAILMLCLSLWSYWDSMAIYKNRFLPRPENLDSVTFRILNASARTPNFKVRFNNGTEQYLSFPDFLGLNPKSGLEFQNISNADEKRLVGCLATARINSIPLQLYDRKQIWSLDCPQAGIHYGPDITGSHVRETPTVHLILNVFSASFLLIIGLGFVLIDISLRSQIRRQQGLISEQS